MGTLTSRLCSQVCARPLIRLFLIIHLRLLLCQKSAGLATNAIARCAFGIETNAHENPDQDLLVNGNQLLVAFRCTDWSSTLMYHLINYFPMLEDKVPVWPEPAYSNILEIAKGMINQRYGVFHGCPANMMCHHRCRFIQNAEWPMESSGKTS